MQRIVLSQEARLNLEKTIHQLIDSCWSLQKDVLSNQAKLFGQLLATKNLMNKDVKKIIRLFGAINSTMRFCSHLFAFALAHQIKIEKSIKDDFFDFKKKFILIKIEIQTFVALFAEIQNIQSALSDPPMLFPKEDAKDLAAEQQRAQANKDQKRREKLEARLIELKEEHPVFFNGKTAPMRKVTDLFGGTKTQFEDAKKINKKLHAKLEANFRVLIISRILVDIMPVLKAEFDYPELKEIQLKKTSEFSKLLQKIGPSTSEVERFNLKQQTDTMEIELIRLNAALKSQDELKEKLVKYTYKNACQLKDAQEFRKFKRAFYTWMTVSHGEKFNRIKMAFHLIEDASHYIYTLATHGGIKKEDQELGVCIRPLELITPSSSTCDPFLVVILTSIKGLKELEQNYETLLNELNSKNFEKLKEETEAKEVKSASAKQRGTHQRQSTRKSVCAELFTRSPHDPYLIRANSSAITTQFRVQHQSEDNTASEQLTSSAPSISPIIAPSLQRRKSLAHLRQINDHHSNPLFLFTAESSPDKTSNPAFWDFINEEASGSEESKLSLLEFLEEEKSSDDEEEKDCFYSSRNM